MVKLCHHYSRSDFISCHLLHEVRKNCMPFASQLCHFSGKRPTFMPSGNAANKPILPYSLGSGLCDFWKTANILQTSVAHSLMIISSLSHVLTTSPEQRRRPRERRRWRRGQQMSGPKAAPFCADDQPSENSTSARLEKKQLEAPPKFNSCD